MTADATLPADYLDLGRLLKDTRESAAMSREEAAERLKIRPSFVEALETGDLARLPGEVYARGYFRAYAELLGYDSSSLLGQIAAPPPKPQATRYLPPDQTSKTATPLFGGIALLVLLFGGWWMFSGRDDAEVAPRVDALPATLDPLLDRGTPRVADALPTPCLEVSGEAATRLCAGGDWFIARRMNDGVPSVLAMPGRFPLWQQARPVADTVRVPVEGTRPRYRLSRPVVPEDDAPALDVPGEAAAPPAVESGGQPLWMRKGRFQ